VEKLDVTLQGEAPGVPSVADNGTGGYLPLSAFGIAPTPIGDEDIINFTVPAYRYNGVTYNSVGVTSNGYLVAGGGTSTDIECCNLPAGPDPSPPNNFLAPFWTDLDGTGAPGIYAALLSDGTNDWVVIEWRVVVFGTTSTRTFQAWLGVNGVQDITFTYPAPPAPPAGQDYLFGAENEFGQGDVVPGPPTMDQIVTSTDPAPGDSVTYTVAARGRRVGVGEVRTEMVSTDIPGGTTVVTSQVVVQ